MNILSWISDVMAPYRSVLFSLIVSFQAYLTATAILFQLNNMKLNIGIFVCVWVLFIVLKNQPSEKERKALLLLVKLSTLFFILSAFNFPLTLLAQREIDISRVLVVMVTITAVFFAMMILRKNEVKEALSNFAESQGGLFIKKEVSQSGDVEICRNIKTGEPVIIPARDRFLHTLILGPTGSGKTSQIILPMLAQDIQDLNIGVTVIEPKSDLAEKAYALAKVNNRKAIYFNPTFPDCPYFNPLFGNEDDVIENMASTFRMLNPDSPQFFLDMNEQLIRNSLKVLKRLYGDKATMIDLSRLIQNSSGQGREMVLKLSRASAETIEIYKENEDLSAWFINDYLQEKSKSYEHTSGLRSQIAKITSNTHLRRVLNPPEGRNDVDFATHLAEGGVLAITTAQGSLRDLGRYLGYFIILQLQSAVFRRPGNEHTRSKHCLYIDEFQTYSNPGFADMLTQGRSYRVASHLATQNRALIGMGSGKDGKNFIELVSTNARNIIIFPGGNAADAEFYAKQFGEIAVKKKERGVSRKKFNPLYGFDKLGYPTETVRETEKKEARFSATDLMYRPFGEVSYCVIKNNSIQIPDAGKITFLPPDLIRTIDEIVNEYNDSQQHKAEALEAPAKNSDLEDIEICFDDPVNATPPEQDYVDSEVYFHKALDEKIECMIQYGEPPSEERSDSDFDEHLRDPILASDTDKDAANSDEDNFSPAIMDDMHIAEEDNNIRDDDNDSVGMFDDEEDSLI